MRLEGMGSRITLTLAITFVVSAFQIGCIAVPSANAAPMLGRISPTSGPAGLNVTVYGSGFGTHRGTSYVTFGSKHSRRYVSWSAKKIVCRVPSLSPGRVLVRVVTPRGSTSRRAFKVTPRPTWTAASAGAGFRLGRKSDGSLWAWGWNGNGQLGLGDFKERDVPTRVGAGTWAAVSSGGAHTLGIKSDGSLWAWGYIGYSVSIPQRLSDATDWRSISAGATPSLAIRADGSLWAWGSTNSFGELGLGDFAGRDRPTRVGADQDWSLVSSRQQHCAAVKRDGSLWTWGYGIWGQLGLGDLESRSTPTRVGSDSDWASVSCGDVQTLALKRDGTLWAWGYSQHGRLGLGYPSDSQTCVVTPTRVGGASDWAAVSAGMDHALALKTDGTLWVWGGNNSGQLGFGNSGEGTEVLTPTQLFVGSGWTSVSANIEESLALRQDGSLWTWGQTTCVPTRVP
jgi:alpha-tubulin suppressor-like RCC1 family protein